jgi:nucleotide-binding universal stress UspA family protein
VSTLTVPGPPVLVTAVDGGPSTPAVLSRAADLAERTGGSLAVVHVVPQPVVLDPMLLDPSLAEDSSARLFPDIVEALCGRPVPWTLQTRTGDPAAELLRVARGAGARMIVVGAHAGGRRWSWRRCTVERLLRHPDMPVLVLPAGS